MKIGGLNISVLKEEINKILQTVKDEQVDSDIALLKTCADACLQLWQSKNEIERQEAISGIKQHIPFLATEHLNVLQDVLKICNDGVGLSLEPIDQRKKKSAIKSLGDFTSISGSDEEGVFVQIKMKKSSFDELNGTIIKEKSARSEREEMTQQRLCRRNPTE